MAVVEVIPLVASTGVELHVRVCLLSRRATENGASNEQVRVRITGASHRRKRRRWHGSRCPKIVQFESVRSVTHSTRSTPLSAA